MHSLLMCVCVCEIAYWDSISRAIIMRYGFRPYTIHAEYNTISQHNKTMAYNVITAM